MRTLVVVVFAFLMISRLSLAEWVGEAQLHMGTEVSVYVWHDDPATADKAVAAVFAEVARIDNLMSTYIENSKISEINRDAAERPVEVGDELFTLILRSLDISVLTHGAFDITYDSVGQHYDFRAGRRPDADTISEELPRLDYRFVEPNRGDGTIRFTQKGVRINLGGIAKGYAVERGIEVLRRYGVAHARVTAVDNPGWSACRTRGTRIRLPSPFLWRTRQSRLPEIMSAFSWKTVSVTTTLSNPPPGNQRAMFVRQPSSDPMQS